MITNNAIIGFEIVSKAGAVTSPEVQRQFFDGQKSFKSDLNVLDISCKVDKVEPVSGSQTISALEVIVGLAGNVVAPFLYDLIKDYIKGKKQVRKDRQQVTVETNKFLIHIHSDDLKIDELVNFVESFFKKDK